MTKTKLDYIQMAKDLTGSDDINVLIAAAKELEGYISNTTDQSNALDFGVPNFFEKFLPFYYQVSIQQGLNRVAPYDFQKSFAVTLNDHIYDPVAPLMHCAARQMGTTLMLGAFALWFALSSRKQSVMVMSNRMINAQEIKQRIDFGAMRLPASFMATKTLINNRNMTLFRNKSSIHYGSPSHATYSQMSHSDLIIMDNAAYFSYAEDANLLKETSRAISRGAVVVISSCSGAAKGFFHKMWEESSIFNRLSHTWTLHPEHGPEFAQRYLQQLGQDRFDQEFNCKFLA